MGKATVTAKISDGLYLVDFVFDNAASKKSTLESVQADLATALSGATDPALIASYKIQIAALDKQIEQIEYYETQTPTDQQIWCVDLGEVAIGATVGTIEVDSETGGGVNLVPAYSDGAVYSAERDGISKFNALIDNPVARFYAMCIGPAKEKWKPRYRYGTILDKPTTDTADISLDSCFSFMEPDIELNQTDSLSDVPIEYMDCNGAAFSNGDEVVVSFTDNDWEQPKVIGFKDNPQPCGEVVLVQIQDRAFVWRVLANDYLAEIDDATTLRLFLAGDYEIANPNPNYTGDTTTGSVLRNLPLYEDYDETIFSLEDRSFVFPLWEWDYQYTNGLTRYPNVTSTEPYFLQATEFTSVGWRTLVVAPGGLEAYDEFTAFATGLYDPADMLLPCPLLADLGEPPDPSPYAFTDYTYAADPISGTPSRQVRLGTWPSVWQHSGAYRKPYSCGGGISGTCVMEYPGAVYSDSTVVQVYFHQSFVSERATEPDPVTISRTNRVYAGCSTTTDPIGQARNSAFETACLALFNEFITNEGLGSTDAIPWKPSYGWTGSPYYGDPLIAVEIWKKK